MSATVLCFFGFRMVTHCTRLVYKTAINWWLKKRKDCSKDSLCLFYIFLECRILQFLLTIIAIFRRSSEQGPPKLASEEKEKASSLMSFVVENRCLVSCSTLVV